MLNICFTFAKPKSEYTTMKKFVHFGVFVLMLFTFYGCPTGTTCPLGEKGKVKINPGLIGIWTNALKDVEAKIISIEKATNYTYTIKVLERGAMFIAESEVFTGWLTELDGNTFLCLQEAGTQNYFTYHLKINDKQRVTTRDFSFHDAGKDAINSISSYRDFVSASLKHDDFFETKIDWIKEK